MKKLLSLILVLLLLTGCSQTPVTPETTTLPETTAPAPTPVGTLYVSFGATLELEYDNEGKTVTLTGTNEMGKLLADAKQDQLNKGCVYTLRSILRMAIEQQLLGDAKTVAFRIGANDPLPTEDFLFTIGQDCQYLVDEEIAGVDMYCLTGDMLDEDGNLTPETAQLLAGMYLEAEVKPAEAAPNDRYTFTDGERSCTVDPFSGQVTGL